MLRGFPLHHDVISEYTGGSSAVRRFVLLLCVSGLLFPAAPAKAFDFVSFYFPGPSTSIIQVNGEDFSGAKTFIDGMARKAIGFLGNADYSQEDKTREFRNLLRANYDIQTIGRFALGKHWRAATPQQQQEYQKLFEEMVIKVYTRRFSDYKGENLDVRSARAEGESDAVVASFIVPQGGGEEVQIDWRVRHKNGQYKIVDVIVEGVSMALTQRSDFDSVIQRGGGSVDVLLGHLRGGN